MRMAIMHSCKAISQFGPASDNLDPVGCASGAKKTALAAPSSARQLFRGFQSQTSHHAKVAQRRGCQDRHVVMMTRGQFRRNMMLCCKELLIQAGS